MHCLLTFLAARTLHSALDREELLSIREIHVPLQFITCPDRSVLYSPVLLIEVFVVGSFFLSSRSLMSSCSVGQGCGKVPRIRYLERN